MQKNFFTGTVPATVLSLSHLVEFNVGYNQLVPDPILVDGLAERGVSASCY